MGTITAKGLRAWWWRIWNPTRRYVWRRTSPEAGPMWRRYVAVRQRQVREPFGAWRDDGEPTGFHSIEWGAERWERFDRGEDVVDGY